MDEDTRRLTKALEEAGAGDAPGFPDARHTADAILARKEFAAVEQTSLFQRLLAHIFLWLDSLFAGVARFGERARWFGPLLEWGLVILAGAGLLAWALRISRRQRLAVQRTADAPTGSVYAVQDWRRVAEERAAAEQWREAIHCLYWASIASLERRRIWAPDRARTPREYLGMLRDTSLRPLLERQTRSFERIWYGLQPAVAKDYNHALALLEQLEATQ